MIKALTILSQHILSRNIRTDSQDYHVIEDAIKEIKDVPGIVCELGTRRGGSLRLIVEALLENNDLDRNVICIDPYGNIDYVTREGTTLTDSGYTNDMRNITLSSIYSFLLGKPINVVFYCLEDTEFFRRFSDGVPFYHQNKTVEEDYSFVFFDGPHDMESVRREIDFFEPRTRKGLVWVFDDLQNYDHDKVEDLLFSMNWKLIEKTSVKGSYVKLK